jgi:hypothetical protein
VVDAELPELRDGESEPDDVPDRDKVEVEDAELPTLSEGVHEPDRLIDGVMEPAGFPDEDSEGEAESEALGCDTGVAEGAPALKEGLVDRDADEERLEVTPAGAEAAGGSEGPRPPLGVTDVAAVALREGLLLHEALADKDELAEVLSDGDALQGGTQGHAR